MPKQTFKKQRHSSLIDTPFTHRTAYFKQDFEADPYKTLPSKSTLKTIIQNENIPLHNKYVNQNQCFKNIINDKLANSKMGLKKNSLKKIVNTCFKETGRENRSDYQSLEKQIESVVDKKIRKLLQNCVEHYLSKYLDQHKEYMKNLWTTYDKQVNTKLNKIEKGYDDILKTYDNFLNIVEKIKDKSFKNQKYVKKVDFQNVIQKTQNQIQEVQAKISHISSQLQLLKKSQKELNVQHQKLKPILSKYQGQQFSLQQLRVVVNTYNQNFMQIDQKLQQLYSYFT